MTSANKLFTYLFYTLRKYDVTVTFMTLMNELRQRLLHAWRGLEQSLIDDAVNQWPTRLRACVRVNGGHFEHTL